MSHSRYFSGVANVRDFGATGDGSTDDREAIQHAIDFSSVVYFPPGTYVVEKRDTVLPNGGTGEVVGVVIPSNTRIFGEPGQSIIATKLPLGAPNQTNAGDSGLSHAVSCDLPPKLGPALS